MKYKGFNFRHILQIDSFYSFLFVYFKARASQLFNAGYKTLASIASADIGALVRSIDHLSKKVARQMVASAKVSLSVFYFGRTI